MPKSLPFMKWETHELLAKYDTRVLSIQTTSAVENPRFIIVASQEEEEMMIFYSIHSISISNIRLSFCKHIKTILISIRVVRVRNDHYYYITFPPFFHV